MPDRSLSSTGTAEAADPPSGGGEARQRAALDRKGGPGHTMLVAVLLAVPVVKIAFTVGGAGPARTVLSTLGVKSLPEVLVGMVLDSPWLGCVLGVVTSRAVFAFFAARGVVPHGRDPLALARAAAMLMINPVAVGVLAACLYGWTWGLATGLVSAGLRQGLIIEYRTGRRHRHRHESDHGGEHGGEHDRPHELSHAGDRGHEPQPPPHPAAGAPSAWQRAAGASSAGHRAARRFAAVEQAIAAALVLVALPAAGLASALDGRSWAPVVQCTLDVPHSAARAPIIEFTRDGTGAVGWDAGAHEVLNGHSCTEAKSQEVRPAWWNG
jgi:hypothetical protein